MIIDLGGLLAGAMLPVAWVTGLFAFLRPSLRFSLADHFKFFHLGRPGAYFWGSCLIGFCCMAASLMMSSIALFNLLLTKLHAI